MTMSFNALKKFRRIGIEELRTRGSQLVTSYRDRIAGIDVPDRSSFFDLTDRTFRSERSPTALRAAFYENAQQRFFPSMQESDLAFLFTDQAETYRTSLIEAADMLCEGRIDLLGFKNLDVGTRIDWHREPVSGIISPRKYWKEFDELDAAESGDKRIVWELNRHQHFFTLGAAYKLTGNEKYARLFAAQLSDWMQENQPGIGINWVSSLEIAFRSISWIWALNLFKNSDELTADLMLDCIRMLYLQGRHIETYLSTYYSPNTHLTGEALGLYYLGTQLPFLAAAAEWRRRGEDILLTEISKQILPDGVYFEQSSWYARYTVDFYLHFYKLRELFGAAAYDERNAVADERLTAALSFLLNIKRPDGTTPLIGDDDGGRSLPVTYRPPSDFRGTLALGAATFGRADIACGSEETFEETFWPLGTKGVQSLAKMGSAEPPMGSSEFSDGGYFVMRDGWSETDDLLLIDCGELGALSGAHGHADALSIDLSLRGRSLIVDPGTFSYSEAEGLRRKFRHSSAHNTLTVDGRSSSLASGPFSWKKRGRTEKKEWISEPAFDFFEGECETYFGAIHRRSILYIRGDYFVVRDSAEFEGDHSFEINFRYASGVRPVASLEGDLVGDDLHRTFIFGEGPISTTSDPISPQYGTLSESIRVNCTAKARDKAEFLTFILPIDPGTEPPEVSEISIDAGRAFLINYRDYRDILLLGGGGLRMRTDLVSSDFSWTWSRAHISDAVPHEVIAVDGSRLSIVSSPIVRDDHPVRFATARRLGDQVYTNADGKRMTVSLTDASR